MRDGQGRFLIANRAVAEAFALDVDQVEGALLADILPFPDDHPRYQRVDEEVLASGRTLSFDDEFRNPAGETRWYQTVKMPMVGASGKPLLLGVSTDITARRKLEQRNQELANFDEVTGLPRRALLEDRVTSAISMARRNGRCVGIVFCDLDRFKRVNDTLGHATGDALLRAVGARARSVLRESDIVARLGGDAMHPYDGSDVGALIRSADAAMYQAKASGRANLPCFYNEIDARSKPEHALGAAVEKAVENDELRLHFQPQMSSRAGNVHVVEALLRWQHPEMGLLLPETFLPLAESVGVIDVMGDWVLDQACSQAVAWSTSGLSQSRVSVNLSTVQCGHSDLVERIRGALQRSRLDPPRLEIEVTEHLLQRGTEAASRFVHDLKSLGVTVAIDEFGTGSSSLSNLTRLPVDRIKVDSGFLHGLEDSEDHKAVVAGIIQMAHALQLTTVAEGVETPEQLHFLREQGCDDVQGDLICPPLNGKALDGWLAQRQPSRTAARA